MTDGDLRQEQRRKSWRFWKLIVRLVLLAVVMLGVCSIVAAVLGFLIYDYTTQPGVPGLSVEVTVPKGATGRDIGLILVESGLVEREAFIRIGMWLDKNQQPIRHGIYELPKGLSCMQLLERLHEGPAHMLPSEQLKITIPEGLSIAQAAALFPNPQAFADAAADKELLARLSPATSSTLEGFLMPNTYFFDTQPPERTVVERMLDQFMKTYACLVTEIPGAEQYDVMKIVTVASLVEEEARVEEERPLVAAVIYNRLDKKMPLQLDSTLQYALGKYGQRMLEADKTVDSPYNTYKHAGLPPGPICSPGVTSLRAALQPANVKHLYFVSNADGKTHTFSGSLAEHDRAVGRFRREIQKQRRDGAPR
jgi:UPF0755 protein